MLEASSAETGKLLRDPIPFALLSTFITGLGRGRSAPSVHQLREHGNALQQWPKSFYICSNS